MVDGQQSRQFKTKKGWKNWKLGIVFIILFGAIVALVVHLALKPEPADVDHNWVFLESMRLAGVNLSSPASSLATSMLSNSTSSTARSSPSTGRAPSNTTSRIVGAITTVLSLSNPNLSGEFTYYDAASFVFSPSSSDGGQETMALAGRGAIAPGSIKPQARKNLSATIHTEFDAPRNSSLAVLATETNLTGYVYKWFVFKHHFTLSSSCRLHVSTTNTSLLDYSCQIG